MSARLIDRRETDSLRIVDPPWESDPMPLPASRWLRASCRCRLTGRAYLAVRFYRPDGSEAPDHYDLLEGDGRWQDAVTCVRVRSDAATWSVVVRRQDAREVSVAGVSADGAGDDEVLAWADEVYRSVPPVGDGGPEHPVLPRAASVLRDAGPLSVVMLGDSIGSDVANGPWDLHLQRAFPGARVTLFSSVVGSRSFAAYATEDEIARRVLPHDPDVVVMSARSGRSDLDGLRGLLRLLTSRTRAEVLVCTDPFGVDGDPRFEPAWDRPDDWVEDAVKGFRGVCSEEGAFLYDLRGAWRAAMAGHDRPYRDFLRDLHHANAAGREIVARLLTPCFGTPPVA